MPSFEIPSRYAVPTGGERNFQVEGRSVRECIAELEARYVGIQPMLLNRKGEIKLFVRFFVDGELLPRDGLDTEISPTATITAVAAAAGG